MIQVTLLVYNIFTFETCHCRVISFVFSEPSKRLSMCIYWMCIICVSVLRFYNISKNSKIERILLRKYYHLMAVLMFLPALIFQVILGLEKKGFFHLVSIIHFLCKLHLKVLGKCTTTKTPQTFYLISK